MKVLIEAFTQTSLCCLKRVHIKNHIQIRSLGILSQLPTDKYDFRYFKGRYCLPQPNICKDRQLLCHKQVTFLDQRSNFSIETYNKYFSSDVPPIGFAERTLETFHEITGLPWWASITLTALTLRTLVTLPLSVYSIIVQTRVEKLQPEIMNISKRLRMEVKHASEKYKWNEKKTRYLYNSTMKKKVSELYVRDNCHPMKTTVSVWVQLPMWVCLSFALRNMSGAIPVIGLDSPVKYPELKTEGTLWFSDLTVPDSTLLLPLSLGFFTLLNIEMFSLQRKNPGKFQNRLTWFLRGMALLMIPISSLIPSSMCCYWVTSSLFALSQNVLLKVPKVRRFFRIQKTPSESQTPFKDMLQVAKSKYIKTS